MSAKHFRKIRARFLIGAIFSMAAILMPTYAQTIPAAKPCFDFTGSGRTSFATVTRGSQNLVWRILENNTFGGGGVQAFQFGATATDNITPGYFDGDNRADVAVYRTTESAYFVRPSTAAANSFQRVQFGAANDISGREADYDGDGRDDYTVVRDTGSGLTWFILRSATNTFNGVNFGTSGFANGTGDIPIAGADYTGDGRAEITVIRNNPDGSGSSYLIGDSNTGALVQVQPWGNYATDFYVVGDYLGDRRADFAVFRSLSGGVNGTWYILENGGTNIVARAFGNNALAGGGDRPICGDYNGDGKQDIAIYRSSNSSFYWLNSPNFTTTSGIQYGQAGDFPVAGTRAY